MRSKRFSKRSFQKRVVNGVRVDRAYLKELAEREQAEAAAEALQQKREAVRRRPKPKPRARPKPVVVEVVEEKVVETPTIEEVIPLVVSNDKSSDVEIEKEAE